MEEVIASTGDIKENYKILGLVSYYFSSVVNKEPKAATDIFDFIINKLKEKASKMNGDAIIYVKMDFENISSGFVQGNNYFTYGTAVKIIKWK